MLVTPGSERVKGHGYRCSAFLKLTLINMKYSVVL